MERNNTTNGGSSETTREEFCFDLFALITRRELTDKDRQFLEFFIGFFEAEGNFPVWYDNRTRVAFAIGQKDPTVINMIQDFFGFGEVHHSHHNEWRWQIEKRSNFLTLASVFAGNLVLFKRQEQFKKLMDAASFHKDQLPVSYNLKKPIFEELCKRISTFSGTSLISFNNGWFAGFWQGDGGFSLSEPKNKDKFFLSLKAYITQDQEKDTLKRISSLISGKEKKIYTLTNNVSDKKYNRLEFTALGDLQNLFSYFAKFELYGERAVQLQNFLNIFYEREKIKNSRKLIKNVKLRKEKTLQLRKDLDLFIDKFKQIKEKIEY